MKPDEKKLKEIIKILYVKEIVGKALFSELENYPELHAKCQELEDKAFQFELSIITKKTKNYQPLKDDVILSIKHINNIASKIEKYRKSMIYFDEQSNFVDLF